MDWIRIEDRQPERGRVVLFCGVMGGRFLGKYCGDGLALRGGAHTASVAGQQTGHGAHRQVIAWCPIPEPYVDQDRLTRYREIQAQYLFRHRPDRGGQA